jgi:hypothetical protein
MIKKIKIRTEVEILIKNQLLKQIHLDQVLDKDIHIDHTQCPWLQDILVELARNNTALNRSKTQLPLDLTTHFLEIDLKITKKYDPSFKKCYFFEISVEGNYPTICVNSLETMDEKLSFSTSLVLVTPVVQQSNAITDDDVELDIAGKTYQLYFYSKGMDFNFAESIREQIFLNENPYPKKKHFDCLSL